MGWYRGNHIDRVRDYLADFCHGFLANKTLYFVQVHILAHSLEKYIVSNLTEKHEFDLCDLKILLERKPTS